MKVTENSKLNSPREKYVDRSSTSNFSSEKMGHIMNPTSLIGNTLMKELIRSSNNRGTFEPTNLS